MFLLFRFYVYEKISDVISFKQNNENKQVENFKNKSNTMNIVFDYHTARV